MPATVRWFAEEMSPENSTRPSGVSIRMQPAPTIWPAGCHRTRIPGSGSIHSWNGTVSIFQSSDRTACSSNSGSSSRSSLFMIRTESCSRIAVIFFVGTVVRMGAAP